MALMRMRPTMREMDDRWKCAMATSLQTMLNQVVGQMTAEQRGKYNWMSVQSAIPQVQAECANGDFAGARKTVDSYHDTVIDENLSGDPGFLLAVGADEQRYDDVLTKDMAQSCKAGDYVGALDMARNTLGAVPGTH
jgi:hypothetical protein